MSQSKRKPDPIKNSDQVIAINERGQGIPYNFGQLKQDYQNKTLESKYGRIMRVEFHGEQYVVTMKPTQGLTFEKVKVPFDRAQRAMTGDKVFKRRG